jgi:hypothetical protein
MRLASFTLVVGLVGCSNDVDPRVIPGGGVSDGEIDGELNVAIIDSQTDAPIVGATVEVGGTQKTTDTKGFVTFSDVEGAQNIAVKATSYRNGMWLDVNGANVTIPLSSNSTTVPQAQLAGSIAGWDTIAVPQGHAKAAFILTSQTDDLGNAANELDQTGRMQLCFAGNECNWSLNSRTGAVTVLAVIVDRDLNGTPLNADDDTSKIIGWAYKSGVTVADGVSQSGLVLSQVEAGNLETLTIDLGTPPPSLTETTTIVGIEVSKDEVIQMPLLELLDPSKTTLLAPKRTVFGANATYRLTAIAQTASTDMGAQAIVLRQGLTGSPLVAGTWLTPPTSVTATRSSASWEPVPGAVAHSVTYRDAMNEILEITAFNSKTKQVDIPALLALPTSGTLTARVNAIGADFDVNDFSLEDDSDLLWGISAQPVSVP